ncbi:Oidioi.mRNA.OKI2018_I69.PAR.g9960.t1.cds [Oikopleura dioica]|uniref:Oidioi.mRNA.OKI2018_I69.PAR.g9960.t1.cds n=1 Tax=Oikopleura dioica TaxID=34765 RepID=A0ABN7RN61_OIKDI|nr:Oidioi.mRNA.OKI2018_I69.PAR.g9960.t1.cds [Oikopleura dioica]
MKFLFLFLSASYEGKISKENANVFLRTKRANTEGEYEIFTSGNFERECIEEACDSYEFHEVYDDHVASEILLKKYVLCKESILRKNDTDDLVDARRSCMNRTEPIEVCSIDLQKKLDDKDSQVESLKAKLKTTEAEVASFKAKLKTAESQVESYKTYYVPLYRDKLI